MEEQLKDFLESKRISKPLKLKIQNFSEKPPGGEETPPNEGAKSEGEETPPADKTFTQSELDSHVSKAVNTALENRDTKHKKEMQQAINDAIAEKERLSKLSEKERKEEQMTQREKEIADKEAEINRKVLRSEAVDDLQKKQLPSEFADFLLGEDAEKTLNNINTFKKTFDEAVNAAVKEKLRQETPPAGSGKVSNKQPSVADLAKENRIIN